MPDTPLICHACFNEGWSWEPCPHTMQIVNASAEKVKALELQIRDLKYEFEQQDMALKNALETAKACDEAASQHAKHLDAANRLLSEERDRCAKIASEEPKNCQNATDDYSKGYLDGSLATAGAIRRRILHETEKRLGSGCIEDQHRGTECKCCHMIYHCCSHHCCCFYRCKTCRHSEDRHEKGPCDFGDNCKCTEYVGERR